MKLASKISLLCLLTFAAIGAVGQVTVTATLTDGTGTTYRTAFLHFQLQNCGANIPVVTGSTAIVQDSFDLRPASPGGSISATVLGNDQILCGNVKSTSYLITPMKDSTHPLRNGYSYILCSASSTLTTCGNASTLGSFNLVSGLPMTQNPPSPGFTELYGNPTNTQTLNQPGGTQMNFQGTMNFCSATVLCGGTGGAAAITVNSGSALAFPVNHQTSATIAMSNPSGSNIQAGLLPCGGANQVWTWTGATWACQVPATTSFTVKGGSPLTPPINFVDGTNTTVTNPSGSNVQINVATPFYNTIDADGSAQTQRPILNLISGGGASVSCADNSGATRTDCTFNGPTSFGTTQPGYWLSGDGTPWTLSSQVGQFGTGTANQVKCLLSRLPFPMTINNLSFRLNTSGPNPSKIALGVYNVSQTKVFSWDNINSFIGSPTNFTTTIATTVLPAGLYWMCTAGDYNSTGAGSEGGYAIPSSSYIPLNSPSGTRVGFAANALSSGLMPATLGGITANNLGNFAGFVMEP